MGEENEGQDLAADMKRDEELLEKIKGIEDRLKEEKQNNDVSVKYYEDANLKLGDNILKVSIAEITEKFLDDKAEEQSQTTYEVYMKFGGEDVLIANIDESGTLKVNKETVQKIDPDNKLGLLELGDQEKPDLSVLKDMEGKTKEDLEKEIEEKGKERDRSEENPEPEQDEEEQEEEEEKDEEEKSDDEKTKEIAAKKHIPEKNVYRIRPDSQFFKNYPMVDKSTYFYRDNDGIMKAEYVDKNGMTQPSPFFEDSTTRLTDPVVSVGNDGQDVKKQRPYQAMQTKGLNRQYGIRDVRMSIYIDGGYINIEESRLGDDNEWVGYGIERTGRDYNSKQVNEMSNTKSKEDNSEVVSERYEMVKDTGFKENGITMDELDPKKTVDRLMDEGYNKNEAARIINYMIGPDKMGEDAAKDKVNQEIEAEQEKKYRDDDDYRTMDFNKRQKRSLKYKLRGENMAHTVKKLEKAKRNGAKYYSTGFNGRGFDREGIHKITHTKYDPLGYDQEGYDIEGYDRRGFGRDGIHRETGTKFNPKGYDQEGYNAKGYNFGGFDRDGIHKDTHTKYSPKGLDKDGYPESGYDKEGFDKEGFDYRRI